MHNIQRYAILLGILFITSIPSAVMLGQDNLPLCPPPAEQLTYAVTISFHVFRKPDLPQEEVLIVKKDLLTAICKAVCKRDDCGYDPEIATVPVVVEMPWYVFAVHIPQQTKESANLIKKQCEAIFRQYNSTHKKEWAYTVTVDPLKKKS